MKKVTNNRDINLQKLREFLGKRILTQENYYIIGQQYARKQLADFVRTMKSVGRNITVGSKRYNEQKRKILQRVFRDINLLSVVDSIPIDLGYIYVISNPNFPGMYKIGSAKDAETRLLQYQTYSPYRDYKLELYLLCKDFRTKELNFHKKYSTEGEWTNLPLKEIKSIITDLSL
ncbi:hypothetical protein [Salmonella phage Stp1]|uniref:Bacteriophage T5 Orf172 DNA-binding domain-containing protein n=1 Tax=Salmonella phage Stp1 TaxID=1971233 RepID=A0A240FFR1_9CAUD|nr:hypothetical protein [Salmonella phage Stp1]